MDGIMDGLNVHAIDDQGIEKHAICKQAIDEHATDNR